MAEFCAMAELIIPAVATAARAKVERKNTKRISLLAEFMISKRRIMVGSARKWARGCAMLMPSWKFHTRECVACCRETAFTLLSFRGVQHHVRSDRSSQRFRPEGRALGFHRAQRNIGGRRRDR